METTIKKISLEDITEQKKDLLKEIEQQKDLLRETASGLFAPVKPTSKMEAIMHSVNSGIAAFDGIMLGMKMVKRIRKILKK